MLNARFESSIHLDLLSQSGLPLSFAHIRQAMGCLLPLRWFANQLNERSPRCKRVKQPVDGIVKRTLSTATACDEERP